MRTGGQSGAGNSFASIAGSQYLRKYSPMGAPAFVCVRSVFSGWDNIELQKSSQERRRFPGASARNEIVSFMGGGVQALNGVALIRISGVHQEESRDRPDRIQFGFPVDQVFKLGRDFEAGNNASKCFD